MSDLPHLLTRIESAEGASAILSKGKNMTNAELIEFLTEARYVSHYESVKAMSEAAKRIAELEADRDEWRTQHENLLSVKATDTATLLARIQEQDELLAKVLADNERLNSAAAFHDAWKPDAV